MKMMKSLFTLVTVLTMFAGSAFACPSCGKAVSQPDDITCSCDSCDR